MPDDHPAAALRVTVDPKEAELTVFHCFELGATAIGEQRVGDVVELTVGLDSTAAADALAGALPMLVRCQLEALTVSADDRSGRAPLVAETIADGFRIVPVGTADDATDELTRVEIDAGPAFGHGGHPSTKLALRALDRLELDGRKVLDLGTGTGVLAIAAAKRGATVTAVDNDPSAISVAAANIAQNDVGERVNCVESDATIGFDEHDVMVANMTLSGQRIVADTPARTEPIIVLSGLLCRQVRSVVDLYPQHDLCEILSEGDWAAVTLRTAASG